MTASPDFIARTRNPAVQPPVRFERTIKRAGDIVIISEAMARRIANAPGAGETLRIGQGRKA